MDKAFFLPKLWKISIQQKHSRCGNRLGTKLVKKTLSNQKPETKYVAGGNGARNSRIVKEGCNQTNEPFSNPFTSNIFLKEKKEGRYWLLVNLQQLNQFVPISLFQNEGS